MITSNGKGGISAKVIADSIVNDIRLTTLQLRYHRFIHSEFMTHRMFSRSASSSRAIPVKKIIKQVLSDPAIPIYWGINKPGMQAGEEVLNYVETKELHGANRLPDEVWRRATEDAIYNADNFNNTGYHKQIVNRLLEPFQFIDVIVTATEWQNFFDLRLHPDAQPEIQELARCMKECIYESIPNKLKFGEWHTPYYRDGYWTEDGANGYDRFGASKNEAQDCSVARCARVSYQNHDKSEPEISKDLTQIGRASCRERV